MQTQTRSTTSIAVFYDGNYFGEVSKYYKYYHECNSRIHLAGLHEFIRTEVARAEKVDVKQCQIVAKHYFRGRFCQENEMANTSLSKERGFEAALELAGIAQHYRPMETHDSTHREKGIDVWLALEAYGLAVSQPIDVIALIACDGDFVPLVRKLFAVGTRVMLLGWDFTYEYQQRLHETHTSQRLMAECSYPLMMSNEIDARIRKNDSQVQNLFL